MPSHDICHIITLHTTKKLLVIHLNYAVMFCINEYYFTFSMFLFDSQFTVLIATYNELPHCLKPIDISNVGIPVLLTQVLQLHFVTIFKLPVTAMAFVCRKSAILIISQRILNVMSPDVLEKMHEAVEKICKEKIKSFD